MNSRIFLAGLTFAVVCACIVHQSEAGWRERFHIDKLLSHNSRAKKILNGPLGILIDIVGDTMLFLMDTLLGGLYLPVNRFKDLKKEIDGLKKLVHGGGLKHSF
ncbi:hypothetical protein PoB_004657100 [Plakobranchus ocellatus]|uniref:Uncharacterized protein n=1 Tax=Plakobranchus ocellatus TaxID=259542 RepID=A0AAV4B9M1_9GAST|nr:hypothetical protein PoB_004657100 [Plakobranchus ocellatus]